ncbi:4'-phosphopantetheinyl transferase family protein [Neolewinella litorea]|uniref:4'-phosphopantetheinyl transferase superfamily protein n=1 Tax=Neolewinella litorea TaxID=2562452 RepID=A0A4S4NJH8_9BACT|nr:4'-phosphopantetheinyl transferase superfamily protein [Neolewinella litorea]THH39932.1 4'-phosphopantetheinyl transferase superfamily protein [Neolewinella litorea]
MPLLFHEPIDPPGEWGLWHIAEEEPQLRARLTLFERETEQLDSIKGQERRREYLAARLLLHEMSGRDQRGELVKDDSGKPHLQDSQFFVSISHTVGFSAAIAHPRLCGIDVQRLVPRIHRLARRFVRPDEAAMLRQPHELHQLHLIWSAKEALYKAYGLRQLDFRENLYVDLGEYDPDQGIARGRLTTDDLSKDFDLRYRIYDNFVLVGAVERAIP